MVAAAGGGGGNALGRQCARRSSTSAFLLPAWVGVRLMRLAEIMDLKAGLIDKREMNSEQLPAGS